MIQSDDPKLTAYALGELSPEESKSFQEELAKNPELLNEVKEIREVRMLLENQLKDEESVSLTDGQKSRFKRVINEGEVLSLKKKHQRKMRTWAYSSGISAIAASVMIFVIYNNWDLGKKETPTTTSTKTEDYQRTIEVGEKPIEMGDLKKLPVKNADVRKEVKRAPQSAIVQKNKKAGKKSNADPDPYTKRLLHSKSRGIVASDQALYEMKVQTQMNAPNLPISEDEKFNLPGRYRKDFHTEAYDHIIDNPFLAVSNNPLSTFSIDVDTASYANMRRFLNQGNLPPKDSVRIEEMINYFPYDYAQPKGEHPFSIHVEAAQAPWQEDHLLMRVGLKGKEIPFHKRPPSNLVFLLDVSGSMRSPNKLPLLKSAFKLLVNNLGARDRVSIVVYAGASGMVLPPTPGNEKNKIIASLDQLNAGGSTNGAAGIQLAYQTAQAYFIPKGNNRVILATDGDFNIGTTNQGDLIRIIEEKAKSGVFLTVLGFGMGNYKDSTLEKLADKGNGNYAYIDTQKEAEKVFVKEIGGTLFTIAKDVKIQIEFNPEKIKAYRLIGYENRMLRAQDFNDDKKDAGEIGAGHTVTALYELVPKGVAIDLPNVDPLKYTQGQEKTKGGVSNELLTLKLRYKEPDGKKSKLIKMPVKETPKNFAKASEDFRFAASVASFGMILRDSPHKGTTSFHSVLEWAQAAKGKDRDGYRGEFVELVRKAQKISAGIPKSPQPLPMPQR